MDESILKSFLLPHGFYVSTVPENLISDSLGYLSGSLFSGCVRIRLLFQVKLYANLSNFERYGNQYKIFFFTVDFRC